MPAQPVYVSILIDNRPWSVTIRATDGAATFRCDGSHAGTGKFKDGKWESVGGAKGVKDLDKIAAHFLEPLKMHAEYLRASWTGLPF